ncbi:MAG: peptidylprolyl isomerase [Xanthobacteraceae bacterium]|nr:MAG: peptidylprolyl isomerase [Xanthobacteraceae bacterium]
MTSCAVRSEALPRSNMVVSVNGVVIPREQISQESQHHPAASPLEAWRKAAEALVVRELLIQQARRDGVCAEPVLDEDGRRETEDEAAIRAMIERDVKVPEADDAACRRYYDSNLRRFRSPALYEAAHILLAADPADKEARANARATAERLVAELREAPERFVALAAEHSACPSRQQGGNLGQIGPGQTVAEFEAALAAMPAGTTSQAPVESRYGFHIIHLDRKIEGRQLPYEMVSDRIAAYLAASVRHRALAQYVGLLAGRAEISGIDLPSVG